MIAPSDVAIAGRSRKAARSSSSGTTTIPPPTPNRALKKPATRPMKTKRTGCHPTSVESLAALAEKPEASAIVLDVDGTLAPIVPRPEDARVPDETRDQLARLARRYK